MADSDPISMVMWVVDAELAFGWGCLSHFANFSFCETGAYQCLLFCCTNIVVTVV